MTGYQAEGICQESERLSSGVWFSRRTQRQYILKATVYYSKRIASEIGKRKMYLGPQGNHRHAFPTGSHRVCLIPPATNWADVCKLLLTRETYQRLGTLGFYREIVMQASFAQNVPKFQNLKKETDVQQKPCYLRQQFSRSHQFQKWLDPF